MRGLFYLRGALEQLAVNDAVVLHVLAEQTPLKIANIRWTVSSLPLGLARPVLAVPVLARRRVVAIALYGQTFERRRHRCGRNRGDRKSSRRRRRGARPCGGRESASRARGARPPKRRANAPAKSRRSRPVASRGWKAFHSCRVTMNLIDAGWMKSALVG